MLSLQVVALILSLITIMGLSALVFIARDKIEEMKEEAKNEHPPILIRIINSIWFPPGIFIGGFLAGLLLIVVFPIQLLSLIIDKITIETERGKENE